MGFAESVEEEVTLMAVDVNVIRAMAYIGLWLGIHVGLKTVTKGLYDERAILGVSLGILLVLIALAGDKLNSFLGA